MVKKVLSAVALASVVAATPAMAQTGGVHRSRRHSGRHSGSAQNASR